MNDQARVDYYKNESFIYVEKVESLMSSLDPLHNSNLWLKIILFRKYRTLFNFEWINVFLKNAFNIGLKNLKSIESTEYRINFLTSLLHCCEVVRFKNDKSVETIREHFLEDYLKNFGLAYYKLNLNNSVKYLVSNHLLQDKNVDIIFDCIDKKLRSEEITKIEYFSYLKVLYSLCLVKRKREIPYLQEYNLKNFVKENNLEGSIKAKYVYFMNHLDPLCLPSLNNGLIVLYQTCGREVFIIFHKKLIELSENPAICQDLIPLVLPTLIRFSHKIYKDSEIQLSNILVQKYKYTSNEEVRLSYYLLYVISFLMLNKETTLKNFDFIMKAINDDLINNCSFHDFFDMFKRLDENIQALCVCDKENTLNLCQILLSKMVDFLCYSVKCNHVKIAVLASTALLKNIMEIKELYFMNSITNEEFKKLFSIMNTTTVNDTENEKDIKFIKTAKKTERSRFLYLDERFAFLSELTRQSRYFSNDILNKVWSFLNEFLSHSLNRNEKFDESSLIDFLKCISLFEIFDYTANKNYLAQIDHFQKMCKLFYWQNKNFLCHDRKYLSWYLSSLLSLNCYDKEAFNDYLQLYNSAPLGSDKIRHRSIKWYINSQLPLQHSYNRNFKQNLFRVNKRFSDDFQAYLKEYVVKNRYEPVNGILGISIDKNFKIDNIVPLNSKKSKNINVPIWLIDQNFNYQNVHGFIRQFSMQVKLAEVLKIPLITLEEREFYCENRNLIFKSKIDDLIKKI